MWLAVMSSLPEAEVGSWDERHVVSGTAVVEESSHTSAGVERDLCRTSEPGGSDLFRTAEGESHHIAEEELCYSIGVNARGQRIVVVGGCLVASMDSSHGEVAWCGIAVEGCHIGPG